MIKDIIEPFYKIIRFGLGGVLSISLKLGLTYLLTELLGWWYFASYLLVLTITSITGFLYNAYVTFRVVTNKRRNFVKFCIATLSFYVVDAIMVRVLTEPLGHYLIAIICTTIVLFFVKYFVFDRKIFTEKK